MFTLSNRIMLVDLSNFSLGATITVYEDRIIVLRHTVSDVSEVKEKVIEIADEMEVGDVFIRPLATSDRAKILEDFENSLVSKNIDKINFHVL